MLFARRRGQAQLGQDTAINLSHVIGGLAWLARHRAPHLELLHRLVEGDVHDEFIGVLKQKLAAGDVEQGAVKIPGDGTDRRHPFEVRLRLARQGRGGKEK